MASGARMVRFAAVGVVNTATDFAMFFALVALSMPIAAANVLSYACGMAVSFTLNRGWTFADRVPSASRMQQIGRFVALNLLALGISTGILVGASEVMPLVAAKCLAVAVAAGISYLGMSRLVFVEGR